MHNLSKQNQFKNLIQHELNRLETMVIKNEQTSVYAVSPYRYANTNRSSKLLLRQPSRYQGLLSFMRVVQFLF